MFDTVTRYLAAFPDIRRRTALRNVVIPLADRSSSQPLTTAGLVISAAASPLAKTGAAAFYCVASGVPVTIAAGTNMPALTGINFTTGQFTVACFFVDSAGTRTALGGTPGATLATLRWPQFPAGKSLIGFLIITHSAAFTGGTTALDTATTVFVSPLGSFDPTVLV